jgi:hypothetical protein
MVTELSYERIASGTLIQFNVGEFLRNWGSNLDVLGGRSRVYVVNTDLIYFLTGFFSLLVVGVEG